MVALFNHLHYPIELLFSLSIGLILLSWHIFLLIEVAVAVFLLLPVVVFAESDLVLKGFLVS